MAQFVENRKVLYVDDEENLLSSFRALMRSQDVETYVLNDPTRIHEILDASGPFAVVLSDQRMPGQDGVTTLKIVKERNPDTLGVMVTGYSDMESTKRAINAGGIVNYISKPWEDEGLRELVRELVSRYNISMERRFLLGEVKLKNETLQLVLQETVGGVVRLLSDVAGSIGDEIAAQNVRIKKLGGEILKMIPGLEDQEVWNTSRAFELFNLGLALLPPLLQMRVAREGLAAVGDIPMAASHNLLAADLLRQIPQFEGVARIILLQRRNFDGTGEPFGDHSKGKDIPLGSRILKILTDLDARSTEHFRGREVLEKMKAMDKLYDVELVGKILGEDKIPPPLKRDAKIPVSRLGVGMVLMEDLVTEGGQLLLKKNATLTETFCRLLGEWGTIDPIASPVRVLLTDGQQ